MFILNEELFEDLEVDSAEDILASPEVGEDTGIAELLMNLIKDEYEAIQGYNNFLANIGTHEEMRATIEDISMEENKHIGQLQALLKTISPNVEAVETGTKEAEEMLDKEVKADAPIDECLNESLDVDDNGYKFEIVKSAYKNNNLPFLALAIKDAEDKDEIGEFWSDITVNLEDLPIICEDNGLCIAVDNDFDQFASNSLKQKVFDALTTGEILTTIPSGFVDFKVYKLKDNILDSIRTIDDFEDEIMNQEN